jgi:hypothetical protein
MSALAFHEKGRSVSTRFLWWGQVYLLAESERDSLHAELLFVATLPSAL